MLPDLEEFQHAQIRLHLSGGRKGVPVRIEASQRIDWPATSNHQNRSRFNVAEQLGDHSRGLLTLLLVSERQVKSPAEYEPMPLIVGRQSTVGTEQVRVFWCSLKSEASSMAFEMV
jgi:hypothetical protein